MKYSTCILIVLSTIPTRALAVDYCSKDVCINQNHIACGNNGDFGPSCPVEKSVVPLTAEVISLLLNKHNIARMNIANGNVPGYLTAKKMIEVSWDNELASFAEMTAKTCVFAHDSCRNTAVFKYAGQNIAISMSSYSSVLDNKVLNYKDLTSAINKLFDSWFNEYANCNMTQISKLSAVQDDNGNSFGHFTQIVMANSQRIGCAIVKYYNSWKNIFLVCDYSLSNVISWPVYTTGTPCSGCNSKCSDVYPGLCEASEII